MYFAVRGAGIVAESAGPYVQNLRADHGARTAQHMGAEASGLKHANAEDRGSHQSAQLAPDVYFVSIEVSWKQVAWKAQPAPKRRNSETNASSGHRLPPIPGSGGSSGGGAALRVEFDGRCNVHCCLW